MDDGLFSLYKGLASLFVGVFLVLFSMYRKQQRRKIEEQELMDNAGDTHYVQHISGNAQGNQAQEGGNASNIKDD